MTRAGKKTLRIVRKFLEEAQAWVDRTPGVENLSMKINSRDVILAEKKH